ncbi:hypothetical protein GCM10027347_16610 [Larkinella harenae]
MKRYFVLFQLSVLIFLCQSCNSAPVSGIYAGIQLRISAWVGGAMERDDIVIYFRPDGTFTNDLKDPNWKKTVKGKFKVSGKEVIMTYTDGDKETYEITEKGNLSGGNFILMPMEMKATIPASSFKYTGGSSSGGIGTNLPYVGTFSQNRIHFDGKGNFSHSRHSTVMVSGDNIGGGTNNKNEDEGTYTYQDGMLTLKYNTGKSQTQSFFFTKDGEQIAAMNGRIYTKDDGKESSSRKKEKPAVNLPTASELVDKAREAHGGKALDAIQNLKVISQSRGILMVTQSDYQQPRTMAEARASGKRVYAEYWDGQKGWSWLQGKKTPLTDVRIRDKEANRYAGFSGLHAERMATLRQGDVEALRNGGYALTYRKDGAQLKLMLDAKYRVVGEELPSEGKRTTVRYENFRTVKGVLLPFTEVQTQGSQRNEIRVTDYFINELEEKDWAEPTGLN